MRSLQLRKKFVFFCLRIEFNLCLESRGAPCRNAQENAGAQAAENEATRTELTSYFTLHSAFRSTAPF